MKKTLLLGGLLVALLAQNTLAAQSRHKPLVMLSLGGGKGTHLAGLASLDLITPSNYFFSVGGLAQEKGSNRVPGDYYSGLFDGGTPKQYTRMITVGVGKVLNTSAPRCRFVLSAGMGVGRFSEPINFVAVPKDPLSFSSNYKYSRVSKTVVGALFSPKVEFSPGRKMGLSVGLLLNINNSLDDSWAFFLAFKFGRVRDRVVGE